MSVPSQAPRKSTPYTPATVFRFRGKSQAKRSNEPSFLPCGCKPYVDILTAGRWRALGRHIRRGETAVSRCGKSGNVPVFCRCQTAEGEQTEDRRPLENRPLAAILTELPIDVQIELTELAMAKLSEQSREGFTFGGWINSEKPTEDTDDIPF